MVVTAVMAIIVIRTRWKWSMHATLAMMLPLLVIDTIFLGANALKIADGGWLPLALGVLIMAIMGIWRLGSRDLDEATRRTELPLRSHLATLQDSSAARVSGTAIFMAPHPARLPAALLHSLKHYKVLHAHNVLLTVVTADRPSVPAMERAAITQHFPEFASIVLRFGYLETPDVPQALARIGARGEEALGAKFDPAQASYFLSRRQVLASAGGRMPVILDRIFIFMSRNANDASAYFQLPRDRVVEIGTRFTL